MSFNITATQAWLLCGLVSLVVSQVVTTFLLTRAIGDRTAALSGRQFGVKMDVLVSAVSLAILLLGGPLALAWLLTPASWKSFRLIATHPSFTVKDALRNLVVVKLKDQYVTKNHGLSPNPLDGEVYTLQDARRRFPDRMYDLVPLDRIKAL